MRVVAPFLIFAGTKMPTFGKRNHSSNPRPSTVPSHKCFLNQLQITTHYGSLPLLPLVSLPKMGQLFKELLVQDKGFQRRIRISRLALVPINKNRRFIGLQ